MRSLTLLRFAFALCIASLPYAHGQAPVAPAAASSTTDAAELRREIASHPDDPLPYRTLANLQMSQHDPKGALATLQQFLAIHPGDEAMTTMAATALLSQRDFPAAETLLRQQIHANDGSQALKIALADVLVHDSKSADAKPLLQTVANTSEDPSDLNNAAYMLANYALDLPLAEQAARKALSLLEAGSANGETGQPALLRSVLLIAVWDTYGWILFRQNKTMDAEPWLRGAWRNGMTAESGFHLGAALERNGFPGDALPIYQQALNGEKGENAPAIQNALQSRIDFLHHAGLHSTAAVRSLQDERTYHLRRAAGLPSFSAGIELEATFEGIQSASYVEGSTGPAAMLAVIKDLDPHLDIPGHAHLVRRGVLTCHAGPTCDLVLTSPRDAGAK